MRLVRASLAAILLLALGVTFAAARVTAFGGAGVSPIVSDHDTVSREVPLLDPAVALEKFQRLTAAQAERLAASQNETIIHAELPGTAQSGDYELLRNYTANPPTLRYVSVKFTGDGFVKSNVIVRVLQSEVDQVQHGDRAATALTERNYKFTYKGTETLAGRTMHVFQVKPLRKAAGLFKGQVYLDASSGSLRRMAGSMAKMPSFWIRKIEFTQDFEDIDGFTMPTELHSTARAHVIGRAVLSIVQRSYHLTPAPAPQSASIVPAAQ